MAQSLRAFPQYQNITTMDAPTGNSTSHALYLKAEKRYARGLTFLVSYAFAKSISDVTFTNTDLASPQDQYNRRAEKSIADVDVPQRLTASFSYDWQGRRASKTINGTTTSILCDGDDVVLETSGGVLTGTVQGPEKDTQFLQGVAASGRVVLRR